MEKLCALINISCSLRELARTRRRIYWSFPCREGKVNNFSAAHRELLLLRFVQQPLLLFISSALINIKRRVSLIYSEKKCCNLIHFGIHN